MCYRKGRNICNITPYSPYTCIKSLQPRPSSNCEGPHDGDTWFRCFALGIVLKALLKGVSIADTLSYGNYRTMICFAVSIYIYIYIYIYGLNHEELHFECLRWFSGSGFRCLFTT